MYTVVSEEDFALRCLQAKAEPQRGQDSETPYEIPRWFAVFTCANREKQVARHFVSREVEHFLPLYESVREWSDRRVKLQMPLFPGYLFVRSTLRQRLKIVTVPGVVNLVGVAGHPMPLPTETIDALRNVTQRIAAQPFPYFTVGQPVSICGGPLKGLKGVLVRHKSGTRVVISIDLIERAFIADVAAGDLVPDGPILGLADLRVGAEVMS